MHFCLSLIKVFVLCYYLSNNPIVEVLTYVGKRNGNIQGVQDKNAHHGDQSLN